MATSQACVPLVTCPEAAPLISALLQRSVACVRADLSEDFLAALSSAYSRCSKAHDAVFPFLSNTYNTRPSSFFYYCVDFAVYINILLLAIFYIAFVTADPSF